MVFRDFRDLNQFKVKGRRTGGCSIELVAVVEIAAFWWVPLFALKISIRSNRVTDS